jgi:hypothetical protein
MPQYWVGRDGTRGTCGRIYIRHRPASLCTNGGDWYGLGTPHRAAHSADGFLRSGSLEGYGSLSSRELPTPNG